MSGHSSNLNAVFYAGSYHPIQAGSIDGTDILPHDNAVYRALLCSSAGLYDPLGDPNVTGDPYCTVFVGRLSQLTTEETLRKAMSKYGKVKNLRLVRHIVTGASRGYAFVEFETERDMRRAYENAHHSMIDDSEIIVDYNRQQLMQGWIPRRLGGGLGGKKESGQLRFGGRERPFRAPLRPIPWNDLKRLGIPPPPEGNYMSRFEVPSPPRRNTSFTDREGRSEKRHKHRRNSREGERRSTSHDHRSYERGPIEREDEYKESRKHTRDSRVYERRSRSRSYDRGYVEREDEAKKSHKHTRDSHVYERRSTSRERRTDERFSVDSEDDSRKSHKHIRGYHGSDRRSISRDHGSDDRSSLDKDVSRKKSHKHTRDSHVHERRSTSQEHMTDERFSVDREDGYKKSSKRIRDSRGSERRSISHDRGSDEDISRKKSRKHSRSSHKAEKRYTSSVERQLEDEEQRSHKRHKHGKHS